MAARAHDRMFMRRRAALVNELSAAGITCKRTLAAIGRVPRERFVDAAFVGRAYHDTALPIGMDQTISQPYTVAYQTMSLDPQPGSTILEIGTGSGYQAAILAEMGARVYSVERHAKLYERSKGILEDLGYRVIQRTGDGSMGWPGCAPFDGIIVTAGAKEVPAALKEQLREPANGRRGGRLIIPVGDRGGQRMLTIERTGPDEFATDKAHWFVFVPLVTG